MLKRFLILGAVALVGGISARYLTTPRAIADAPPSPPAAPLASRAALFTPPEPAPKFRWEPNWQVAAPRLVSASFSLGGDHLAWADDEGSIRQVNGVTGTTVWQSSPSRGLNRVSVARAGTVVAYSHLNPAKPSLRLFDARYGDRKSTMIPLDGAVWSVAAAPDGAGGEQVWVTTGQRLLYCVPLRPGITWPGIGTPLPGIADTLDVATGAGGTLPLVLVGMWQETGVGVWGADRLPRWQQLERDLRRTYQAQLSRDGKTAIATSGIGAHGADAQLHVWDAQTGKRLWDKKLIGDNARASVSADGSRVVVTFRQLVDAASVPTSAAGPLIERRKIALFDRAGRRLFNDKGGSFFAPELVCLSPDGNRVTVRDKQDIWTFDGRGARIAHLRLKAPAGKPAPSLRQIVPLPDASGLLLVTGDGLMTLYKAL